MASDTGAHDCADHGRREAAGDWAFPKRHDGLRYARTADLSHAPWHKAADHYELVLKIYRPDHSPPGLVRLSDDGIVGHIDPHHDFGVGVLWQSHAIVTVLRLPVGVSSTT